MGGATRDDEEELSEGGIVMFSCICVIEMCGGDLLEDRACRRKDLYGVAGFFSRDEGGCRGFSSSLSHLAQQESGIDK